MLYLKSLEPAASDTDMLVIPVCEDTELHDHPLLSSMVARIKKLHEFKGAKGDEVVLYDPPGAKAHRVIFTGLGPAAGADREVLRAAAGRVVKQALQKKLPSSFQASTSRRSQRKQSSNRCWKVPLLPTTASPLTKPTRTIAP
jgi:hypothetical protein